MYYPMRTIQTRDYKLIKYFNYKMPFPIDQDFYISPTYQDMLNRTKTGQTLPWIKTLHQYYYRDMWELFDIKHDPKELKNLASNPAYSQVLVYLQDKLRTWQNTTAD